MPNPSLPRREKGLLRHTAHQLLTVDVIRYAVAFFRHTWFARVRSGVATLNGQPAVAMNTVSHNLRGLRDLAVNRSLALIRPLSVIESLAVDSDLLVVGPRTEGEILALMAYGFERSHVEAIDLISYSPWIKLGDVHELPYADDSFDAVMLGWVLAYSEDPRRAASEVLRVVRPGGVIAVGVEWNAKSDDEILQETGYLPGANRRIASCAEILDLFEPSVGQVIFFEDAPPDGNPPVAALIVIFSVPAN